MSEEPSTTTGPERELIRLDTPADGLPEIVDDERRLLDAARALGAGTGPLAVDAERASGYRYGQRAYLVQVRREGAGTWLLDPAACPDLSPIAEATAGVEWVLHAATQDLPCLAEVGMRPQVLFDTELGARLAGLPRVGLAAVVEHYLGLVLAKEHSAVDWSTRPLPESWLTYAALDVEVLVEVRDALAADLAEQGKLDWALEEFAALTTFTGPPVRTDPWRRTAGVHKVRGRRSLAVLRELWYARDDIARTRDIAPGRVIADAVLIQIASAAPTTTAALAEVSSNKAARRYERDLVDAVRRARDLPDAALPVTHVATDGPPPPRAWTDKAPVAAARLAQAKNDLGALAAEHHLPMENLLSPDTLRRTLWSTRGDFPDPATGATADAADVEERVAAALAGFGARRWQIALSAPVVAAAICSPVSLAPEVTGQ